MKKSTSSEDSESFDLLSSLSLSFKLSDLSEFELELINAGNIPILLRFCSLHSAIPNSRSFSLLYFPHRLILSRVL
mgnify:CR=1 FL=1